MCHMEDNINWNDELLIDSLWGTFVAFRKALKWQWKEIFKKHLKSWLVQLNVTIKLAMKLLSQRYDQMRKPLFHGHLALTSIQRRLILAPWSFSVKSFEDSSFWSWRFSTNSNPPPQRYIVFTFSLLKGLNYYIFLLFPLPLLSITSWISNSQLSY